MSELSDITTRAFDLYRTIGGMDNQYVKDQTYLLNSLDRCYPLIKFLGDHQMEHPFRMMACVECDVINDARGLLKELWPERIANEEK